MNYSFDFMTPNFAHTFCISNNVSNKTHPCNKLTEAKEITAMTTLVYCFLISFFHIQLTVF